MRSKFVQTIVGFVGFAFAILVVFALMAGVLSLMLWVAQAYDPIG